MAHDVRRLSPVVPWKCVPDTFALFHHRLLQQMPVSLDVDRDSGTSKAFLQRSIRRFSSEAATAHDYR